MRTPDRQAFARRANSRRAPSSRRAPGQALVEAGVGIVCLLLLTFSIIDAAMLFFAYLTLENGVSEATRFAVTGRQASDPHNPAGSLSREDSVKLVMRDSTPGITIADGEFSFYDVTRQRSGAGGPNDVIQVTVTHPWQLISPMLWPFVGNRGVITLRVSSTMKNEPFPTA